MNTNLKLVSIATALTVFGLAGCGAGQKRDSDLQEAPDSFNLRDRFGITTQLNWDAIQANTKLRLAEIPWTDTYWPLYKKETAARWSKIDEEDSQEIGFAAFLRSYASESAKSEPSVGLSPAEKYDLVYQLRHNRSVSLTAVNQLADMIEATDSQLKSVTKIEEKKSRISEMRRALANSPVSSSLSMTSNGWDQFLGYSSSSNFKYLNSSEGPGESWGWMGICHGWAPAAIMSSPPKHGSMAQIGGKNILFTEGDIRGLLSRAWAQRAPSDNDNNPNKKNFFLGRRCNENVSDPSHPIASNSRGRGYTGTVDLGSGNENFTVIDSLLNLDVRVRGKKAAIYKIELDSRGSQKILLEVFSYSNSIYAVDSYHVVDSFSALVQYLNTQDTSLLTRVKASLSGCWDVNPATFHEVLVEQLGVRKMGFVMDRTRTGQVWNQPVYQATFKVGELTEVKNIQDVAAAYRASGTAYVAQVEATVSWISEPSSPQMVYPTDYDLGYSSSTDYVYTLEFDSKKNLIGGEWGTFEEIDPQGHAPDFLYGYTRGAEPVDLINSNDGETQLDYSGIIKKLLACSQSATIDGKKTFNNQVISYTNCPIN